MARVPALVFTAAAFTAPEAGAAFENRSEAAGLGGGGDACWADFDNDGFVDLVAGGKIYRNVRGERFEPFADMGASVAGDFDNDGFADLFAFGPRRVYRNEGGRSFTPVEMPELPASSSLGACWGDFNGDGYLDLYIGGYEVWPGTTYPDMLLLNRAGERFELAWSEVRYRARGVTACDFDRDGDLDVYVSNYRLQPNILWLNNGEARFADVAGDYNALATSPGFGGGHSIGACWGDFDNDGQIDLFAGNFAHQDNRGDQPKSRWLRNRGPGEGYRFEDLGPRGVYYQESYASPSAGDYDNDGDLDLLFTTVYGVASFGRPNFPVLYRNDGGFQFTDVKDAEGLGGLPPTYQSAWADYDNDGDLDVMVAGRLYQNQGTGDASWLKVRLVGDGRTVNRSAIGAQVRIPLGGGRVLTRQVEAGTGQGNQNALTLHFGLGARRDPVDLEVFWPDGSTQTVTGVELNQTVTVSVVRHATITAPAGHVDVPGGSGLMLAGTRSAPGVRARWTAVSAPAGGEVFFDHAEGTDTAARFTLPGDYRLRLTGELDGLETIDEVGVTVLRGGSAPPPLAWWKLDEGVFAAAGDFTRNGYHGLRVGFADVTDGWAEGFVGGGGHAVEFSPADEEFIDLGEHAPAFAALGEGTLSVWFRTNTVSERTVFSISRSGLEGEGPEGGAGAGAEARLYVQGGRLFYHVRDEEAGAGVEVRTRRIGSNALVNDDVWHHAAVAAGPGELARLFVDGELVGLGAVPFLGAVDDADDLAIGRAARGGAGESYFRGGIDDVRVYATALGTDEVGALAAAGNGPATPRFFFPAPSVTTPGGRLPLELVNPLVDGTADWRWAAGDGPGAATFTDPARRAGSVRFSAPGRYTLRLVAEGPAATLFRELAVDFTGGPGGSPLALDLPDLDLPQGSGALEIDLFQAFHDEEDPDEALGFSATAEGDPIFVGGGLLAVVGAPPRWLRLEPTGTAGSAEVKVRAEDTAGLSVETSFQVTVANRVPLALPQTLEVAEGSAAGTVVGSVAAADPDGEPLRFLIAAGNGAGALAIDPASGELTVRDPEALDFETAPVIDLEVLVAETANQDYLRVPVTVALTDVAEPPQIARAHFSVDAGAADGTEVGAVVASAPPAGGGVSFSITAGDPEGVFAIDPATGVITVADGAALDPATRPRYDLTVRAQDDAGLGSEEVVKVSVHRRLTPAGAPVRWTVPTNGLDFGFWRDLTFDDAGWASGPMGLGYETGTGYEDLIATDVAAGMEGKNTSIYLRVAFDVADPETLDPLSLRVRFDDGFIAYLNGVRVAEANAPAEATWESGASVSHDDPAAVELEPFLLGAGAADLLVPGRNVLAIHGLNVNLTSSDFLVDAVLVAGDGGTSANPFPPSVSFSGGTSGPAAATFSGSLEADGGAPDCAVYVVWAKEEDHGRFPAAWPNRQLVGVFEEGETFELEFDGLDPGRGYVFRCFAENPGGRGWSGTATATMEPAQPVTLVSSGSPALARVPTSAADGTGWREPSFSAGGGWIRGTAGVGYELDTGYEDAIGTDVAAVMPNRGGSVYTRFPFLVGDPGRLQSLVLRMQYDDGFVAYLNGVEVTRANAPVTPGWDALASVSHDDGAALVFEEFDISAYTDALQPGFNTLAIQGLNATLGSSDLLILPELEAAGDPGEPAPYDAWAFAHGLTGGEASRGADPDGDGASNFAEFARGRDPATPDRERTHAPPARPATRGGDLFLEYDFRRRTGGAAGQPGYAVELSGDLRNWGSAAVTERAVTPSPDGETEWVTVALDEPVTGMPQAFVRLRFGGLGALPPEELVLLGEGSNAHVHIPTAPQPGWASRSFNDFFWSRGGLGVGYENSAGYEALIGTDVGAPLFGRRTSVYVRVPFELPPSVEPTGLTLRMRYDDGFVAYLNGVEVARANAPVNLAWDSAATGSHDDTAAVGPEAFDLSPFVNALRPGDNVLAVHGLNVGSDSSDLLVLPELVATVKPGGGLE